MIFMFDVIRLIALINRWFSSLSGGGSVRRLYLSMILVLISALTISCKGEDESSLNKAHQAKVAHDQKPALLKISKIDLTKTGEQQTPRQLLFLYRDEEGKESRALSIDEIPLESRKQVQVIDLALSPEERGSRAFIQLFDLREANTDGQYQGRVVNRSELERALASAQALPEQTPIVLYSTSWCGVCKKAKRFMEEQGLAFVEKDIEKDKEAARELQEKCERAKVPLGGVPVIDVGGQLMRGFDANRLMSMLKSK